MPVRKPVRARDHDMDAFAERYDLYRDMYGDPIEFMFRVMANKLDGDVVIETGERIRASEVLMSHRFPKIKAQEIANPNTTPLNFSINITQPSEPLVITGTKKVLEIKSSAHALVDDLVGERK